MLPIIFGAAGVSGMLYLLLNFFWPGWYLDYIYRTKNKKVGDAVMEAIMQQKYIIDFFEEFVAKTPKKTLIIFEDQNYSYEYFDKKANEVVRTMMEIGVKPGDIVAVIIYNEPAIVWTYLGCMKAGIQVAFINYNLRSKSLAHCVNVSGAKVLVVGDGQPLVEAVIDIVPEIPDVSVYLQGPNTEQKPAPFLSFDLVMSRMSAAPIDKVIRKHVTPVTPCIYIYTSGTTGLPKPAIVGQVRVLAAGMAFNNFDMTRDDILYEPLPMYHSAALLVGFANVITKGMPKPAIIDNIKMLAACQAFKVFGCGSEDILYEPLPLYHSAGLILGFNGIIVHGATMVLRDKFSASHFWDDCRKHNVTIIQYIGEVCRYLVARPKSKDDGNHKIKVAFGNGLRQDIWAEFVNRFKIPNVVEFYGATECPIGLSNLTNKFGACGRSSPYLRQFTPAAFVKFDLESQSPYRNRYGRCVPIQPDEVGLLIVPLIEGKSSFQGYKGKKEDSDKKLLYDVFVEGDKYFNSGDLMKVDKEYYLYFNDRVGDTFRWKGENVSTTEISNMLTDLDFIQDANVYGVTVPGADGRAGMVSIIPMDENMKTLTPDMLAAISKHVSTVLPMYARPRFLRFQSEFSMTSTFKQQKTTLVKEGYDVNQVTDPLFYFNVGSQSYMPMDHTVYTLIMAGKVPL